MSRLRLYGIARTRAFRALWMVEELGLDYEHLPIETGPVGTRKPDYLAVNPNGRLPAIDDDGFVLWESLAVNLYLAKKHALGRLYPTTLEDEAKAWQWSLWAANEIERGVNVWSLHAYRLPPEDRDPKLVEQAIKLLSAPFSVLDRSLADRPYLLGPEFTVADLNVAAVAGRAVDLDMPETPRLAQWLQRCMDRPAALKIRRMRETAEATVSVDAIRRSAQSNRL